MEQLPFDWRQFQHSKAALKICHWSRWWYHYICPGMIFNEINVPSRRGDDTRTYFPFWKDRSKYVYYATSGFMPTVVTRLRKSEDSAIGDEWQRTRKMLLALCDVLKSRSVCHGPYIRFNEYKRKRVASFLINSIWLLIAQNVRGNTDATQWSYLCMFLNQSEQLRGGAQIGHVVKLVKGKPVQISFLVFTDIIISLSAMCKITTDEITVNDSNWILKRKEKPRKNILICRGTKTRNDSDLFKKKNTLNFSVFASVVTVLLITYSTFVLCLIWVMNHMSTRQYLGFPRSNCVLRVTFWTSFESKNGRKINGC